MSSSNQLHPPGPELKDICFCRRNAGTQLLSSHPGASPFTFKTSDCSSRVTECFHLQASFLFPSLMMANLTHCPWRKRKHVLSSVADFHLAHMESKKRPHFSEAPPCEAMPFIITAFSSAKILLHSTCQHIQSPSKTIPQSFGGLTELRGKLHLLLKSTLEFYKSTYPGEP